jgi:predicted ATPase
VTLFAERAHAIDGRFALGEGNVEAVIELCRALDGLPLAIELAAARAPTLGMRPLLESMQDRLRL